MAEVNHTQSVTKNVGSIAGLDSLLRSALGASIAGISVRFDQLDVHFLSAPGAPDSLADQIVNTHNTLIVSVDQSIIAADGIETATITCADPVIAGDSEVVYRVWLDEDVYSAPSSASVSGGSVELTLTTEDAGIYVVEIKRHGAGNYQTGYITIEAQEVR